MAKKTAGWKNIWKWTLMGENSSRWVKVTDHENGVLHLKQLDGDEKMCVVAKISKTVNGDDGDDWRWWQQLRWWTTVATLAKW
jgi:hypothetical protein